MKVIQALPVFSNRMNFIAAPSSQCFVESASQQFPSATGGSTGTQVTCGANPTFTVKDANICYPEDCPSVFGYYEGPTLSDYGYLRFISATTPFAGVGMLLDSLVGSVRVIGGYPYNGWDNQSSPNCDDPPTGFNDCETYGPKTISGTITVCCMSEPWTKGSVSWNNKPDFVGKTVMMTVSAVLAVDGGWSSESGFIFQGDIPQPCYGVAVKIALSGGHPAFVAGYCDLTYMRKIGDDIS